jgi:hypothetical protein
MSASNNNALVAPTYDKIPLSHLLEAAVQQTYHKLYTMADVYVFYLFISNRNLFFLFSLHSTTNLER